MIKETIDHFRTPKIGSPVVDVQFPIISLLCIQKMCQPVRFQGTSGERSSLTAYENKINQRLMEAQEKASMDQEGMWWHGCTPFSDHAIDVASGDLVLRATCFRDFLLPPPQSAATFLLPHPPLHGCPATAPGWGAPEPLLPYSSQGCRKQLCRDLGSAEDSSRHSPSLPISLAVPCQPGEQVQGGKTLTADPTSLAKPCAAAPTVGRSPLPAPSREDGRGSYC